MSKKNKLSELENIIKKLRSDTGCPWDRELDFESLKTLTLEETYELIDALEKNDDDLILDELSDLLVHILLYSEIANSSNLFNFDDILDHARKKLIKRHPHVFDKANFGNLKTPEEVEKNWTKLKGENTNPKKSFLDEFNFLIQVDDNHDLADNCQYWIGEVYYALNNYNNPVRIIGIDCYSHIEHLTYYYHS